MQQLFPFTAIVNQERMKRALILNAINPQIGGVLIRGERGTAKSTAARALAALLPDLEVIADCPFNCDPHVPEWMCDHCRGRLKQGAKLSTEIRQTRFVDLPVSATEDRVVGTLDIEKAIQSGEKHFEPGLLAAANRGLLYVDEVNLLDDHVVDLLLDSAAMGVNFVEREGISFEHPARFILVGTMNPEEGELRPQLLDRFALCVEIKGLTDPDGRVAVLERRIQFEEDPDGFLAEWRPYEQQLTAQIATARRVLPQVTYTSQDLHLIAELTASFEVDGHRADIVILKAALANAAFHGRDAVEQIDILQAAELALPHRLHKNPFEDGEASLEMLQARLDEAQGRVQPVAEEDAKKKELAASNEEPAPGEPASDARPVSSDGVPPLVEQDTKSTQPGGQGSDRDVKIGAAFAPRRMTSPLDRLTRRSAGRRSYTRTLRKRGRYTSSRPLGSERSTDIAFDATFRAAAIHQRERADEGRPFSIHPSDLHQKVRVRRAANCILFAVDASWSMAAAERIEATKGAIVSLLHDAYQKRDAVGLVVFHRDRARVVLRPTSSVDLARKKLQGIPVGGKTPLPHGLWLSYQVLQREIRLNPEVMPMMILLTDGAGNVPMYGGSPRSEALQIAALFRRSPIRSVVINMEHIAFDRGLAQELADALAAPCYTLEELHSRSLVQTVRDELASGEGSVKQKAY
jgi:magnesium chelatase subunit D